MTGSMQIAFLETAQGELDGAIEYYNRERHSLGDEFLIEVLRALDRIAAFPEAWPQFSTRTRRCLLKRFPYGIIYQYSGNSILVIAVAHLHRKPDYWKRRHRV
ncbi:MAG: hypothetical protein FD165_2267 [Gammaproteobacteria bacterium]|nr:MAG: hypothetical protein FD165_2267 [Gammaproteobacteria bacterium]TND03211.1 MAG: hypothetical protein FD120_1884 [Gammaproteobacteria bacterium]